MSMTATAVRLHGESRSGARRSGVVSTGHSMQDIEKPMTSETSYVMT